MTDPKPVPARQWYDRTDSVHVNKLKEKEHATLYAADSGRFWVRKADLESGLVTFDGDRLIAPIWWLNKREFI